MAQQISEEKRRQMAAQSGKAQSHADENRRKIFGEDAAPATGGGVRGSTAPAPQQPYKISEGPDGRLGIKYGERAKSFTDFESFFKANPDFKPAEGDLELFNKHKFFVPENEPKPDSQGAMAVSPLEHMRMAAAGQPGQPTPSMVQHQIAQERGAPDMQNPAAQIMQALGPNPQEQQNQQKIMSLLQVLGA